LSQISIIGAEGKPILYASLTSEGHLFLEFEYYGRSSDEGDYEFSHTVRVDQFSVFADKFGLSSDQSILSTIQQITDLGRGQELKRLLTENEIKNELWTWLNTP
jgi:hypothetical protein